ncbi:hypothetical protein QBC43DRAFT_320164 [Cladorrhinum sp. PSN259]|nr:hypothetical protein QBC43DRAFT_320164 [Cladorrhinum sp. PSN259]
MHTPAPPKRQRTTSSHSTSSNEYDARSRRSNASYGSDSTAPTSMYSSPSSGYKASPASTDSSGMSARYQRRYDYHDDVSPTTSLYPRDSVETYASTTASSEDLNPLDLDEKSIEYEYSTIPPLPIYRRELVEPNVRPSTPQDFAKLFPSLNRLTIRHDEFTADGNMNLRIDTVVTGRKRTAIQLFHLRMYDLAKREFSLRRYCRDSGREVCNSKRKFIEPTAAKPKATEDSKPALKRSMTSAIKSLGSGKPVLRRAKSGMSAFGRPSTGYSSNSGDEDLSQHKSNLSRLSLDSRLAKAKLQRPEPTNTIKLEFSNYARVDVNRRGGKNNKRYEFEWWGHKYSWKRHFDKQLNTYMFHLVRDGNTSAPVAHIVPESRSPSQVAADEKAGGWIPPCFMWIADEAIVEAVTDVADVIMATGLMALVDDCIKERWQTPKVHTIPVPLTSRKLSFESVSPKAFVHNLFQRRHSDNGHPPAVPMTPLRTISAY